MRKYFQFAALLVVTMLSACSGGTESKEAADTAMEDKPVVRLASVTSRDVDQIEEYTATVEAEAKNNIAPTSPGRIDRIFVEVGDHVSKGQKLVQMDAANLKQMKLQLENEETEFYCKAVEHANNRIDRALTKLDELTIDAEDFFCDEDFESACEDLGFASCENAEEASSWDYTETINNEMIAEKEISAEDTLNSSDFPSDEEIVKNICDVHGSCGEDYKKESSESEAASEEENQIPIIKDNHIHPFGDTEK